MFSTLSFYIHLRTEKKKVFPAFRFSPLSINGHLEAIGQSEGRSIAAQSTFWPTTMGTFPLSPDRGGLHSDSPRLI